MTPNTDAIRAEADLEILGRAFEYNNCDAAKRWARATKTLCDHIDALTEQCADARAINQSLSTLVADYDRQVQDLKNEVFELKTRLDVEKTRLRVACIIKRATTREALTKAFADLSNALWEALIPDPVNRAHVATTLHRMHVAVHNS